MNAFQTLQSKLDALIPMPGDLPVVYLLGDTGAGKTCFVRQLLGTTEESFPSVRPFRTTVAPTEFIITNEANLKAAFVFKTEDHGRKLIFRVSQIFHAKQFKDAIKTIIVSAIQTLKG